MMENFPDHLAKERIISNVAILADTLESLNCGYAHQLDYKIDQKPVSRVEALRSTAVGLLQRLEASEDAGLDKSDRAKAEASFVKFLEGFDKRIKNELEFLSDGSENLKVLARWLRMLGIYPDHKLPYNRTTLDMNTGNSGNIVPGLKEWNQVDGRPMKSEKRAPVADLLYQVVKDIELVLSEIS